MSLSEELKYQPSKLALSLQQNQTHTIGVLVPNLDFMLSTMVKGIDEVALEAGYTVMVCQSNESFGARSSTPAACSIVLLMGLSFRFPAKQKPLSTSKRSGRTAVP
jgi:DNA-binding LacI/PurR family transcriptional regulator